MKCGLRFQFHVAPDTDHTVTTSEPHQATISVNHCRRWHCVTSYWNMSLQKPRRQPERQLPIDLDAHPPLHACPSPTKHLPAPIHTHPLSPSQKTHPWLPQILPSHFHLKLPSPSAPLHPYS
ncbi:hypothetical protein K439DRAFT_280004 [Ramaria rubella]|nr:hypothetical protein K439DRAFT_280004 [Ramaria rubella]